MNTAKHLILNKNNFFVFSKAIACYDAIALFFCKPSTRIIHLEIFSSLRYVTRLYLNTRGLFYMNISKARLPICQIPEAIAVSSPYCRSLTQRSFPTVRAFSHFNNPRTSIAGRVKPIYFSRNLSTERSVFKNFKPYFTLTGFCIGAGATGLALYLNDCNRCTADQKLVDAAIKHNSPLFVQFVSKKYLKNRMFYEVSRGKFEKAKFLIEAGEMDVNRLKKYDISDSLRSALLEMFHPKTESELIQYMDFSNFVLNRGYSHLNRPVMGREGGCNLLLDIYDSHIFEKEPDLRRQLIAFYLEKGVDPLYKCNSLGSSLQRACFEGDGEFFINACKRLNIDLNFSGMSKNDSYDLFSCCIVWGSNSVSSLKALIASGLRVGDDDKQKLLKELNDFNYHYTPEEFEIVKKMLEEAL